MEICYGISLSKLLQMNNKFSESFMKSIACQVKGNTFPLF